MTLTLSRQVSEGEFMQQVIQLAKIMGWKVYHTQDSRKSVEGFPDLVLLRRKRMIVAELKSLSGRTTNQQTEWLNAFRVAEVQTYLWTPDDWPEIERELRAESQIDRSHP